ncbi:DNA repair protein rad5 [Aulographum hederae CBS 113979]|uniref:DNA repair protein rad5 n=1 Tax=Aulographum hederae CBS 113979 TaxID=1176131 RepID=A0A6G1H9Y0_9PEZI|nr:DNA repair protein rad5 [Aulographum hederae CBS 113979]
MSSTDVQERPAKKRRFFVDDAPVQESDLKREESALDEIDTFCVVAKQEGDEMDVKNEMEQEGFSAEDLAGIVGELVSSDQLQVLRKLSEESLERAINIYFDGSWRSKTVAQIPTITSSSSSTLSRKRVNDPSARPPQLWKTLSGSDDPHKLPLVRTRSSQNSSQSGTPRPTSQMPLQRYIGAFGVTAWATRSGTGLIKHGEFVRLERQKSQPKTKIGRGGKLQTVPSKRQDIVVRFTNMKREEIGRLENDTAVWVSALLDQEICVFYGTCVYAPEKIRSNDTIYLQLRCSMLRSAFDGGGFAKPENNRESGFFEAQETQDERNLRMRQVALVKLLEEINLHPSSSNEITDRHKRKGLLQAAEVAEQYEQKNGTQPVKAEGTAGSSPPSDDAEEGEELQQDQLDSLYKKAQSFDFNTPVAEPADTFNMSLRKYQRQALYWMMSKEKDEKSENKQASMHPLWEEYTWPLKDVDDQDLEEVENQPCFYVNPYSGELSLDFPVQEQNCLGGILADEMGLGKTIEMLSLIHSHKSDVAQQISDPTVNSLPRLPANSTSVEKAPCTTLVVAPMSLLAQWQSEAEKASAPGSLRTLVYYGSEKSVNLQTQCCEANAANAPNVIITSYGVVLSEFNQVSAAGGNRGSHGGLFSLEYFRIILDEAHYIKNRSSKTAKACYELAAEHRWVLTGTPIVNRLEDLFSLVHFLRVEPWSNFSFWKTFITVPFESKDFIRALDVVQTVLEPLVLRRTKDMKTPDGKALVPLPPRTIQIDRIELSKAEREVYDYVFLRAKRTFNENVEAGTLMKSYTTIFAQILRLRQCCCHPVLTRNKNIVAEEEDAASAADIANGLGDDMDLQALIDRFTADEGEQDANKYGAHVLKQIQDDAEMECPICSEEPMNDQTVTGCWHSACKKCLLDYIDHQKNKNEVPRCFNCRADLNTRDVFEVVRHDVVAGDDKTHLFRKKGERTEEKGVVKKKEAEKDQQAIPVKNEEPSDAPIKDESIPIDPSSQPQVSLRRLGSSSSAKISALLSHLKQERREAPATKSVVFSQFTSFLDLIEPALTRDRIPFLRFDGSMTQKARAAVLTSFAAPPAPGITTPTVLLLSLRAGGVGLNLTCAKRVFMMDPWWSFAVEAQAIDRVHRMGQESEVKVVRFVVEGSIEEKMLRIQERKAFIAGSLGMMGEEEKRVRRLEDIRELLS